jgi:hypothetical protein
MKHSGRSLDPRGPQNAFARQRHHGASDRNARPGMLRHPGPRVADRSQADMPRESDEVTDRIRPALGRRLRLSPGPDADLAGARPARSACVCKPLSRRSRGALELSQSRRARARRATADDTRPVEVEPVPVVAGLGLELLELDIRGRGGGRPASGRRRPGLLGLTRHRLPAHPVAYRHQQPARADHVPAREELHWVDLVCMRCDLPSGGRRVRR